MAQRTAAAKAKSTETPAATPKATTAKKTVVSTPAPAPAPARPKAAAQPAARVVADRRPPAQHGTVRMANEGCDCDLCRTALSDYRRERATADW